MEKLIGKICGLLQSPDGMRRCAAAMVLTELAPKDAAVVKALGEAMADANQLLTRYVLEAFEAIGSRGVIPYVLPLLEVEDAETKLRAAAIVARVGGETVGELKRHLEKASTQQKLVLVDILARIHGREAMRMLLDVLFDPDFDLVREACQAVRRHIVDATPKERVELHRQVIQLMKTSRVKKNERVLTSCLLLTGYIGAPDAWRVLLQYTTARNPLYIRRHALLGLKGLEFTGSAVNQVARSLFACLAEPDFLNIVQHALDILEKLPLGRSYERQWRKLLKSKHPSVRAFAGRRLAAADTAATNRLLMALLQHEDPQVSEIAAGALARHKGATKLLLDALARERKTEAAWRLAKILKPHSETVDKKALRKFTALAARLLEAGDPRHEALIYFLRNIDPRAADTVLRDAGLRFKKSRKWARAVECLRQLVNTELFDHELRYELTIANLKQSPKELAPHLRAEDHALRGIQALVPDRNFKLFERLKKDRILEAADLFYVGFHFAEGRAEEQSLGRKLLEHVAKRWPRSKEAKAARNKLKLVAETAPADHPPAGPQPAPRA